MWPGNPNAFQRSSQATEPRQAVGRGLVLHPGDRVLHERFVVNEPAATDRPGQIRAHDLMNGDMVHLRLLRLRSAVSDPQLDQVRQDIRRAAASPHPHIVRISDVGIVEDTLVLATEPQGMSLRTLLTRRRLSPDDALTFARQIGAALVFAHTHSVIHGIVSPATIEIVGDSAARLADFGLHHVVESLQHPNPADLLERPGYLAPEELHQQPCTRATDMYHFGALLWELVLGAPPPQGNALPDLARHGEVDADLRAIITQCLQPDAADRPATLGQVLPVLRTIQREQQGQQPSGQIARLQASRQETTMLGESTAPRPIVRRPRMPQDAPTRVLPMPRHQPSSPLAQTAVLAGTPTKPKPPMMDRPPQDVPPARATTQVDLQGVVLGMATDIAAEARLQTGEMVKRIRTLDPKRRLALLGTVAASLVMLIIVTGANLRNGTQAAGTHGDVVVHGVLTTLVARTQPYRITRSLVIGAGQTLKIQPGAVLSFAPGASIMVQGGVLDAEGSSAAPVLFTSASDPSLNSATSAINLWQGIAVNASRNGKSGTVKLDNVTIRYAGTTAGAALSCGNGSMTITNSLQSDSGGIGLSAAQTCSGEIAHSTFQHNVGDAADIKSTALQFHDNVVVGSAVSLP